MARGTQASGATSSCRRSMRALGCAARQKPWPGVVIVGIDIKTLESGYGQFPFPPVYDAQMIDRLRRDGARTIAFDLIFDHGEHGPSDDLRLYEATGGRTADRARRDRHQHDGARLCSAGRRTSAAGVWRRKRRLPRKTPIARYAACRRNRSKVCRASPVAAARDAGRLASARCRCSTPARSGSTSPGLPARCRRTRLPTCSTGVCQVPELRGRIVVIGATASYLQDQHAVGGWGSAPMSGPGDRGRRDRDTDDRGAAALGAAARQLAAPSRRRAPASRARVAARRLAAPGLDRPRGGCGAGRWIPDRL